MREEKKKKAPKEPLAPWGDIALDAIADPKERERVAVAMAALDRGDHALVRALSHELAGSSDAKVRDAAARLAARLAIDPVQVAIVVSCALFLIVIALTYVF